MARIYTYTYNKTNTNNRDTASAECPANPWRIQNQALFGRYDFVMCYICVCT